MKSRWLVGAVVLGGVIVGFGSTIGAAWFDLTPLPFVIAAVASGLIVAAFGRIMPARTVEGARALERVLGFEEFLRRVEGDRLERVVKTPEMFERFLPFAMAFGVERKWAKAFQDIYREPPTWYVGSTSRSLRPERLLQPAGRSLQPDRERHELVAAELGRIGVQRGVVGGWVGRGRWGRVLTPPFPYSAPVSVPLSRSPDAG